MGLGKMFADPNLLGKLAANPRTQKHLADPAFIQKVIPNLFQTFHAAHNYTHIQMIQKNPRLADG